MKRPLLILFLVLSQSLPALPQESPPIQTAQAEKPAAAEESVALPDAPVPTGLLIGVGVGLAVIAAGITVVHSCDDSEGCGSPQISTTGTR